MQQPTTEQPPTTEQVFIEVPRARRRPRYHRAERDPRGHVTQPEQCNIDQVAGGTLVLEALPDLRRPWSQLCRRCFRGTAVLAAADALRNERDRVMGTP